MQRRTALPYPARDAGHPRMRLGALLACTFALLAASPAESAFALSVQASSINASAGNKFSGGVATLTDFGPLSCKAPSSYSATVAWADNTSSSATIGPGTLGAGLNCTYPISAQHTFATAGVEQFAVTVTAGTSSASDTGTATVTGSSITATPIPLSAAEARTFSATLATFTSASPGASAGQFSATIDWGDGASGAGAITNDPSGSFGVFGSHAYANPGSYTAHVTIAGAGGSTSVDVPITISDAQLNSSGVVIAATEGMPFSGAVAAFADPDATRPAGYYAASVAWGDGTISGATITAKGNGAFLASAAHTYSDPGGYTVTVTIADPAGSQAAATSSAQVADAPIAVSGLRVGATEGSSFSTTVASFRDADGGRPPGHYSAAVAWGDGTPPSTGAVSVDGTGGFLVDASHTYAHSGAYAMTITVADPSGQASASGSVSVVDAPVAASGAKLTGVAGSTLQATVATFTDADPSAGAGQYTAIVSWGDGAQSAGGVSAAAGGFAVSGAHAYAAAGTYTTTIAITDDGGSSTTATGTATIAAAPPPKPTPPTQTTTHATTTAPAKLTAPEPAPELGVSSPRLVGSNAFSLRLTCPAVASHCRGVARVVTLAPRGRSSPLRGGTTLGSTVFVLAAGQSRVFTITVAKGLRSTLRKARSARLVGVAIAYGANGHNAATTGPTAVISTTRIR